ncbi:hypothetical protein [Mesorhizobium sp. J18]|uniref:hypothetical protein n=1 Tax=Mesorhizobium sp. J18 TaxID=935263 RepID=UPI00119F2A2E|nr:hypothetical protein [Mesorhizobium sp. J18]
MAETSHFSDATETDEQLKELYDQAADLCLRNPSRDVQVIVACTSMSIYGMALNERGLCRGKENQANAFAEWHKCEADSLRFPEIELPAGFR